MIGLFAGAEGIGGSGVDGEVGRPVVHRDPRPRDDDAGTEAHIVGLDIGDHVPLPVGGAEVDGAAFDRRPGAGVERFRPDQRPAGGGVFGREEHLGRNFPHKPRVGDIFLGVHKGQLHRLDLLVEGKEGIMFRFKPLQDVQRH